MHQNDAAGGFRRIVTGHDAQGQSIVVSDGPTPNVFGPEGEPFLINFWATQAMPVDYMDPADPADSRITLGPPANGINFRYFRVPPEANFAHLSDEERRAGMKLYHELVGAPEAYAAEDRHPGFHRTQTIDFIVLLEGEVSLLLDREEVQMRPFDVVIQRGTSHSWVNRGNSTALLMAVLIDGRAGA